MTGTLHECLRTFVIISRTIPLRSKNISDIFVPKIKIHFIFNIFFRKNLVKSGTAGQSIDDDSIRYKPFECRITKGTDIHSEYLKQLFDVNTPQCYFMCTPSVLC
jgi:hypothetical protein